MCQHNFQARFSGSSKVYLFCHLQRQRMPVPAVCVFLRQKIAIAFVFTGITLLWEQGGPIGMCFIGLFSTSSTPGQARQCQLVCLVKYFSNIFSRNPCRPIVVAWFTWSNTTIFSSFSALSLYQCMHLFLHILVNPQKNILSPHFPQTSPIK